MQDTDAPGIVIPTGATRRQFVGRMGGFAALLALPALQAGCFGGDSPESDSGPWRDLQWGMPGGVDAISYNDYSITAPFLVQLGLEGLLQVDPTGAVVPWLADRFENKGNQEFVLRLRDGVTWSDGTPLTIEDVVFQYQYNLREKAQPIYGLYSELEVDSAEQTGPREITVRTKRPNPRIPAALIASQAGWLVKPDQLRAVGYEKLGSPGALPIGTGPFVFDEFVPDSTLTVSRNEGYWATKQLGPLPETVTVRLLQEESSRLLAARSGQISGALYVGVDQLEQYASIGGWTTYTVPELGIWFFAINNKQAPFDDVHFRRAVAYSLDREGIAKAVWAGKAQPATTLVPPQTWKGFLHASELRELEETIPVYGYDLDKARAELAKSKYPEGHSISIRVTQSQPQQAQIAQILAESLAKIGVRLDLAQVSESQWFAPIANNRADDPANVININNYPPESRDPAVNLNALLWSENAVPGRANTSNFTSDRVDELLAEQAATTNARKRAAALAEIVRIAADDVPYIPIVWPEIGAATGPGIDYEHPHPFALNGGAFPASLRRTD